MVWYGYMNVIWILLVMTDNDDQCDIFTFMNIRLLKYHIRLLKYHLQR